jgi:BMFP domain-containing protein YqiC
MPSERVTNLVNIATNLIKKKLALRESAPAVFETLQNIDDQFRAACNAVVLSQEEDQFTEQQQYLVNSAITGVPRIRLIELEKSYTSDDTDVIGELRDIKQVNFHNLDLVKKENPELYAQMAKAGIVTGGKE